jgi:hypothetical protein
MGIVAAAFLVAACSPSFSGRVTYDYVPSVYSPTAGGGTLDFPHAVQKPVRNAAVQIMQGTTVLKSGTTDENGHYLIEFDKAPSGQVDVVVLAKTANPVIQIEDNTDGDAIWAIGKSGVGPGTHDLHAPSGWMGSSYDAQQRRAAPFAILDSMYTAAHAFMADRTVTYPALKVNWSPNNVSQAGNKALGQIGTSHFSPAENEIYVLGKEGVDTDEFDSHVIVHEWGHFFEKNLSRSDSPGGSHSGGQVNDPRLAFGEGYGNGIAAVTLADPIYSDTLWSGDNIAAFGFDAENEPTPTDDPYPGPFSEMTVMRLLYHLWDSKGTAYDNVAVGLGPIYDTLVGPEKNTVAFTTIGSFIAGLKAQAGVNAAAVDTLLAHYSIGPITDEWGTGDTNLLGMYTGVPSFPSTPWVNLDGGFNYNSWHQNQYYVFTGNGGTITVSASSVGDVGIWIYKQGTLVASADNYLGGSTPVTETTSFTSVAGATYVVSLVGFNSTAGEYRVDMSFTNSP